MYGLAYGSFCWQPRLIYDLQAYGVSGKYKRSNKHQGLYKNNTMILVQFLTSTNQKH